MKDMSVKEIAELCNVDERTVQRWANIAADKMSSVGDKMSAAGHGKAALYGLPEVLAIVRAGGKATLAALLEENAAKNLPAAKPKLPNGKQTEFLYRLYHEKALSPHQVQLVLGVAVPRRESLPEVPIDPLKADSLFRELENIGVHGRPQLELLGGPS